MIDAKEQELIDARDEANCKRDEVDYKWVEAHYKLWEAHRKRDEAHYKLQKYRESKTVISNAHILADDAAISTIYGNRN